MHWALTDFLLHFLKFFAVTTPIFALEYLGTRPIENPVVPHWRSKLMLLLALHFAYAVFFSRMVTHQTFLRLFEFAWIPDLRKFWASQPPLFVALCSFVSFTFVHYWAHVARHRNKFLWRWCHEMHHSSRRFDTFICYYLHPMEVVFSSVVNLVGQMLLGFGAQNFFVSTFIFFVINAYVHTNIKTPFWIGRYIYRPEQHSQHHNGEECNFGIIPIWDYLFGTFKNPASHPDKIGFDGSFWGFLIGKR